jgi:tetratricopeptide (TPR) repeat protein
MTKSILIVIALSLSIFYGAAQRQMVDSLLKLLPTAKDDTSRLIIMDGLIEAYKNVNLDSGVYYAQQEILITNRMNDPYQQAYALNQYGHALFFAGNYPEAVEVLLKALQQFENHADTFAIASSYLGLGFVYRNSDEYRKAIEYFIKYKEIADYYNNDWMRSTFFADAGRSYEQLNILDTALLYQQQAYDLVLRLSPGYGAGGILCNLGTVHSKLGNNSPAVDLFRQGVEQSLTNEDFRTLARCYNEIGKAFL